MHTSTIAVVSLALTAVFFAFAELLRCIFLALHRRWRAKRQLDAIALTESNKTGYNETPVFSEIIGIAYALFHKLKTPSDIIRVAPGNVRFEYIIDENKGLFIQIQSYNIVYIFETADNGSFVYGRHDLDIAYLKERIRMFYSAKSSFCPSYELFHEEQ